MSTCSIVINEYSRITQCANDTGRVEIRSNALKYSAYGAIHESEKLRVQTTTVVNNCALDWCTGAVILHGSDFSAGTLNARATERKILNCLTAHVFKLGTRQYSYAILLFAFCGATSAFERSHEQIFF